MDVNNVFSSSDITANLYNNRSHYVIEDKVINEAVLINRDLACLSVEFRKCTFQYEVKFSGVNLNLGIKLVECQFDSLLSFTNCTAKGYDQKFNTGSYSIEIYKTQIDKLLIHRSGIERGVFLADKSIIGSMDVRELNSDMGGLSISDSSVNKGFNIYNSRLKNNIDIREESVIDAGVRVFDTHASDVSLISSTFKKDLHFVKCTFNSFVFNDGVFNDDFYIRGVSIKNQLTIIGTEFKKSFKLDIENESDNCTGSLENVHLSSTKFGGMFLLKGSQTSVKKITINYSKKLEGAFYIENFDVSNAELKGDNYSGNVVFKQCNFNMLNLNYFYNYSTVSIIGAKAFGINSCFLIENSNLGKLQIFNTSLVGFDGIEVSNSVLTDIITVNVDWFDPKKLNQTMTMTKYDFVQKKEIFRQLKHALEKQGDRIESLKFKSLEMKTYKEEIFYENKWYQGALGHDRFILWLGQTNNFGLNWLKPVFYLLLIVSIFYFIIVVGLSEKLSYTLDLSRESIVVTHKELVIRVSALPQLLNPVHSLDKVFPLDTNRFGFWIHFLDYLLKIIVAFFIFQIISAFRKFAK